MKTSLDHIFINNLPSLDLHGEIRASARVLIKEFIEDNYNLRKCKVVIVHGNGTGALKDETFKELKKNKYVLDYKLNLFNPGCTLIYLKKKPN